MWTWRPATAVSFRVLTLESVAENLQRLCNGVWLNRVGSQVIIFSAAAIDRLANMIFLVL
ncbi:hypothetical protein AMTRI_Chr02g260540 [Amborella trichopoda]